jgi:hypothetical protein
MAGWSSDKENPGLTWFDDIEFFEGYYPYPSPIHSWAYPILMSSSVGSLLSDIPTFSDRSLVVSAETVSPGTINDNSVKQIGQVSSGLILMGDALPNSTLSAWLDQFPRLMLVYEAESVLQPENGTWEHLKASSDGTSQGVAVSGIGQASQNFFVPRDSNYTIAVRVASSGGLTLRIDKDTLTSEPFSATFGQLTSWYQSNSIALRNGEHTLTVIANGTSTVVDKILMLSSIGKTFRLQDLAPGDAPSISFTKTSSTHFSLQLNAQGPVFVMFGETYDSSWNAYDGIVKLDHESLPFHMYWSNLYTFARFGQTTVEVYFEHQQARNTIVEIWGIGWLFSLAYVSFGYRDRILGFARKVKRRGKWWI